MIDNSIFVTRIRAAGNKTCDYKLGVGLNVFKGSNSTGKTTLMWFLDYAFGSKTKDFIPEVQANCDSIIIDLEINSKKYTVKRSLANPNNIIVYSGHFDELKQLSEQPNTIYGPLESKEKKSISDFYLGELGIHPWNIPTTKSDYAEFSWRNLMPLIYIPQDKWNGFQAQSNYQPLVKKAVFEIMMGIDTKSLQEKEVQIRDVIGRLEDAEMKVKGIKQLISDSDRELGSEIYAKSIRDKIENLEQQKEKIHLAVKLRRESNVLVQRKQLIEDRLKENERTTQQLSNKLDQLSMLYNENDLNLERNRILLKAKKVFSELPLTKCPRCFNELVDRKEDNQEEVCSVCGQDYKIRDKESDFAQNLFLLMDDQKDLSDLMSDIKEEINANNISKEQYSANLIEINAKIDQMNKEIISPVLKEVEAINTMLNQLNRKLGEAEKTRTLLNEETLNEQKILDYKQEIKVLRKVIDDLTKESTSASMVKSRFLEILNSILANILHLDEKLLDLDEEYLPVFEEGRLSSKAGREDIDKSKSVKKILGYYTAVVEFSLKYGSFHPRLLLLDTPRQDELDFTIFSKILEYWIDLKHYGKPYQIVITGAEFPITIKTIAEFHNPVASEDYSKPEKYSVM